MEQIAGQIENSGSTSQFKQTTIKTQNEAEEITRINITSSAGKFHDQFIIVLHMTLSFLIALWVSRTPALSVWDLSIQDSLSFFHDTLEIVL